MIPGQGTKIPWAAWQGQKIKKNSAIIRLFFLTAHEIRVHMKHESEVSRSVNQGFFFHPPIFNKSKRDKGLS